MLASCAPEDGGSPSLPDLSGDWVGYLEEKGGNRLLTVLSLRKEEGGGYSVSVRSPTQSGQDYAGRATFSSGSKAVFRFNQLSAVYRAELDETGAWMRGSWSQRGAKLPLECERQKEPFVFARPQDPAPPYGYESLDIAFPGGVDGVSLAGTLTYPKEGRAKAGIVLISGSGAQDRNESIMGHKPFLVLADRLTKAGYAVLRYDDRGTGMSSGDFPKATSYDFLADALAALAELRRRPELRAASFGAIGHSEGGLIATLLAGDIGLIGNAAVAAGAGVDFAVSLAGPAFPGDELLHQQSRAILESQGKGGLAVQAARMANEKIYAVVKDKPLGPEMTKALKKAFLAMGVIGKNADAQIASLATPWFKTFLEIDPGPSARSVRIPFLALYGSKDVQVPSPANSDKMRRDLEASGRRDAKVELLDGLNHLFQRADKGTLGEYGTIAETMNEKALETLIAWLDGLER